MHPTKTRLDRREQRQHSAMILEALNMSHLILTNKWKLKKTNETRQKINMPNRDSMQELSLLAIFGCYIFMITVRFTGIKLVLCLNL